MDIYLLDRKMETHQAQATEEEWQKDIFIATLNNESVIAKKGDWAKDVEYAAFDTLDDVEIFKSVGLSARRGH